MEAVDYEYAFTDGPFDLVVTLVGAISRAQMIERRGGVLGDPRLQPGMCVLYDLTGMDATGLTADDIRTLARDSRRYEEAKLGAVAVAAPAPLVYGLIRMFEAYATDVDIAEHVTVVDSVEAAYRWLEGLAAD